MTMIPIHTDTGRSHTKVGLVATRLPAGPTRLRLLRLAQRGSDALRRSPENTRGHRLVTLLCDALAMALTDLAIAEERAAQAERSLAAAQVRIAALERRLRADVFDEPTRKSAPSDEVRAALRSSP